MKASFPFVGISMLIATVGLAQPPLAHDKHAEGKERIGIYDSRAIAVAFAGSASHKEQLQQLMEEHKKAKTTGDLEMLAKLEAEANARQEKAHSQAFSTAPVDEILAHIADALPEIKKNAGVTVIVSKWDATELEKHPRAETVDVTMKLVDAFQPNERQRKSAIEIQKHKPISLKQDEKIKD